MQKNLRLVKKGRLPRVDIVVPSVRKVRFSLSEQRECIELRKGLKVLIFGVKHKKIFTCKDWGPGRQQERQRGRAVLRASWSLDGEVGLCRAVAGDVGELVRGWSTTGGGGRSPKIRIEQSTDRKRGRRGPCTVTALCPLPNQTTWDQPTRPLLRCTTSGHCLEMILLLDISCLTLSPSPLVRDAPSFEFRFCKRP